MNIKLEEKRINDLIQCNEPIIAIGSVMRSGGNMLNRLFDNHINLRTYHSELLFSILSDNTNTNPKIKLATFPKYDLENTDTENIFDDLAMKNDIFIELNTKSGWIKTNYDNPLPFYYDRLFHKKIFLSLCEKNMNKQRDIFDNYMTGFFNSYWDYQNLYGNNKKYITNYWPGFILYEENVKRFFKTYPEGRIISVIRNPFQWAGSAKKRRPEEFGETYMDNLWLSSIEKSLHLKEKYSDKFILINFDDLVIHTKNSMNTLCEILDISFHESLLEPTFNGMSIEANSIFILQQKSGIVKTALNNYKKILDREDMDMIEQKYINIFNKTKSLAIKV